MKSKNKEKASRTLKEEIALIVRGYKLLFQIGSVQMFWRTVASLFDQLSPYFSLFMSALLINEIAAGGDYQKMLIYALIIVGGELFLNIIRHFFSWKNNLGDDLMSFRKKLHMLKTQCTMQFKHFEDPDTAQLGTDIYSHANYGGHGLSRLYWTWWNLLSSLSNIILSASLTVSMLKISVNADLGGFLGFINSPWSILVILFLIVSNIFVQVKISNADSTKSAEIWGDFTRIWRRNNEYMSGIGLSDITVLGMNKLILRRAKAFLVDGDHVEKSIKSHIKYESASRIWTALMDMALFIFVGAKAYIGIFGIGNFILYQGTVARFIQAVSDLGAAVGRLKYNNTYLEELFRYLDLPDEMYKGTLSVEKRDDNRYEIEFRNVSFKYPGSDVYALKNVSVKFRIGERLAFVGMNGSGKSTFVKLLCRLYDPTEGRILLNGIDITKYKYHEYMALFSVVFQDFALFDFNIGENVSASLHYDAERVKSCLCRVGLSERLDELEHGIETHIGKKYQDDGVSFSGGEKQKIALARALYKNGAFIILDEPTAALDPIAEAEVYSKFNDIVGDKTAIYISHRLSTCRFCDNILVFDNGQIIQRGSHDELVSDENGKYHELWYAQAQYYTEKK